MDLGLVLAPMADPTAVIDTAVIAEQAGFEAIALWDHYHSAQPEWAYAAGWSLFGGLAMATHRVQLVPMVLNGLHHEIGRLAKETAMLDRLSGGRFELGIGIGDWPASFAAWGAPFPDRAERTGRLIEILRALDTLWRGGPVTTVGKHVRLEGAISAPGPANPIRIVGGAGASRRVIEDLAPLVDELNVYPEPDLVDAARRAADSSARCKAVSVHFDWSWDRWPANPGTDLERMAELGVDRTFAAIAGPDTLHRIEVLADARRG